MNVPISFIDTTKEYSIIILFTIPYFTTMFNPKYDFKKEDNIVLDCKSSTFDFICACIISEEWIEMIDNCTSSMLVEGIIIADFLGLTEIQECMEYFMDFEQFTVEELHDMYDIVIDKRKILVSLYQANINSVNVPSHTRLKVEDHVFVVDDSDIELHPLIFNGSWKELTNYKSLQDVQTYIRRHSLYLSEECALLIDIFYQFFDEEFKRRCQTFFFVRHSLITSSVMFKIGLDMFSEVYYANKSPKVILAYSKLGHDISDLYFNLSIRKCQYERYEIEKFGLLSYKRNNAKSIFGNVIRQLFN